MDGWHTLDGYILIRPKQSKNKIHIVLYRLYVNTCPICAMCPAEERWDLIFMEKIRPIRPMCTRKAEKFRSYGKIRHSCHASGAENGDHMERSVTTVTRVYGAQSIGIWPKHKTTEKTLWAIFYKECGAIHVT